jgi:hypothetical protein
VPRNGVTVMELTGLGPQDAVAVLAEEGVSVPQELEGQLEAELGGHPVALHLFAQVARQQGLEAILDGRPEQGLTEYLLQEIAQGLTERERVVLGHASIFPVHFTPADVEALGSAGAEAALVTLHKRRLVLQDAGSYRLPEVVRNFFYERLQDKERLHALVDKRRLERARATNAEAAPTTKRKEIVADFAEAITTKAT